MFRKPVTWKAWKRKSYEFNENMWAKILWLPVLSEDFLSIDASKAVSMICKRRFYVKEEFSPPIIPVSLCRNPWDINAVAIFRRTQPALVLIMFSYQPLWPPAASLWPPAVSLWPLAVSLWPPAASLWPWSVGQSSWPPKGKEEGTRSPFHLPTWSLLPPVFSSREVGDPVRCYVNVLSSFYWKAVSLYRRIRIRVQHSLV